MLKFSLKEMKKIECLEGDIISSLLTHSVWAVYDGREVKSSHGGFLYVEDVKSLSDGRQRIKTVSEFRQVKREWCV